MTCALAHHLRCSEVPIPTNAYNCVYNFIELPLPLPSCQRTPKSKSPASFAASQPRGWSWQRQCRRVPPCDVWDLLIRFDGHESETGWLKVEMTKKVGPKPQNFDIHLSLSTFFTTCEACRPAAAGVGGSQHLTRHPAAFSFQCHLPRFEHIVQRSVQAVMSWGSTPQSLQRSA